MRSPCTASKAAHQLHRLHGCPRHRRHWRKPGWLVAALFSIGSILFVISGSANLVTAVGNPANPTLGGASAPAGLIGWPNAGAAKCFFFPAGLIQVGRCGRV